MKNVPINPIMQARAIAEITRMQVESNTLTMEQVAFRLSRIAALLDRTRVPRVPDREEAGRG